MRAARSGRRPAFVAAIALLGCAMEASFLASALRAEIDRGAHASSMPIPAKDLTGVPLGGSSVNVAGLAGKMPVVINFWAPSCNRCAGEDAVLRRFSREFSPGQAQPARRVQLVGVCITTKGQDMKRVRAWWRNHRRGFPNIYDSYGETALRYRVQTVPTTYVVDLQGEWANPIDGALTYQKLKAAVAKARRAVGASDATGVVLAAGGG